MRASKLNLPSHFEVLMVLALGTPGETVMLEHGKAPEPVPYWRDAAGMHHVPKRPLDEITVRR